MGSLDLHLRSAAASRGSARRRLVPLGAAAALVTGALAAAVSAGVIHSQYGPSASHTNAPAIAALPPEDNCTACHFDYDNPCEPIACNLNTPGGGVEILDLPATYLPGVAIPLRVRVWSDSTLADPGRRWGFQITAVRLDDGTGIGTWVANPETLLVEYGTGPYESRRYLEHGFLGTRTGLAGPVEWSFAWTPPAENAGRIGFYISANAANGDDMPGARDFIFTGSAELAPDPTPVVASTWGALKRRFR